MPNGVIGSLAGLGGGGQQIGTSSATIVLDTTALAAAAQTSRQLGREIEQALGQTIGRGAQMAESNFQRVNRSIRSMRGELLAIGATGGILTGLGLNAAANLEEARIQLRGMVGDEARAAQLMDELRRQAARAGLPFGDMLQVATQLLPTLEGNTEELETWFDLVRRTAVLNRREGLAGAAFAIREAITSGGTDLVSLSERFNISRVQLREALEETGGDFAAALDMVLERMGITTQVADEMGRSFNAALRSARDAALQLLGEGFTPLLNTLTPLSQQTATWLSQLRETQPQVATTTSGLIAMAAAAAPAALLFNQLAEAAGRLRAAGVLGALGRLGVGGLAVGAGAAIGIGASRAIGAATGSEELQRTSFASIFESLRQLVFNIVFTINRTVVLITNGLAAAAQSFIRRIADMLTAMGGFVAWLSQIIPGRAGAGLQGTAGTFGAGAQGLREFADSIGRRAEANDRASVEFLKLVAQGLFPGRDLFGTQAGGGGAGAGGDGAQQLGGFGQEQADAIRQWADSLAQVERQAQEQRLETTRQYEQQRTDIIANYERQLSREAEDFARQRQRQQEQLDRQIRDIRDDAAEREVELRQDTAERIAELEEDYSRDRERALRDHRNRLLSAAGRLDAIAVAEEQRRFADQQADAEEAHRERIGDERDALEERLRDSRDAEAERIDDLRQHLAEQQRIEDEDRAIRLQRQADDHSRQLAQLDADHQQRLEQITRQLGQERQAINDAFGARLEDLGLANGAWVNLQKQRQEESLRLFDEFWGEWKERITREAIRGQGFGGGSTVTPSNPAVPTMFQAGGWVQRSGWALVHAGEYVVPRQQALAGVGGVSFSGNVSVSIMGGTNMGEGQMYDVARRALLDALREMAS